MGHDVRLEATRGPGHGSDLAEGAVREGYELVVAAGGDGTVNEVVQPLVGTHVAMGAIPIGTVNLWAAEAGLPAQADLLAGVLSRGDTRRIDVGRVGGRCFLLMASLGLDAATVQGLDVTLKRRVGRLAYGASFLSLASGYRGSRLRISLDGKELRCTALVLVVGNTRRYAGPFLATPHAIIDDGMLDIAVLRGDGILDSLGQLGAIVSRSTALRRSMLYGRASTIDIQSEAPIPLQVDGEFLGYAPARIETLPAALSVVVGTPKYGLFKAVPVGQRATATALDGRDDVYGSEVRR
jgi:diacylglycerol kinase (ATP)